MLVRIEPAGFDRAATNFRGAAQRARDLYPVTNQVRERWHESEQRLFRDRPWTPRAASTIRRYQWTITAGPKGSPGPIRYGIAAHEGVGSFTGRLERALTRPHQPGVRDDVIVGPGSLTLNFGVKAQGPVAHGRWFEDGPGDRPPRPLIIFDQQATDDSAEDVQGHIWADHDS